MDVELGSEVFISFQLPGDGKWMNAEAEVSRIIQGFRSWDPGPAVGLQFKELSNVARGDMLVRLAGIPPIVPRRPRRNSIITHKRYSTPAIPLLRPKIPRGVFRSSSL